MTRMEDKLAVEADIKETIKETSEESNHKLTLMEAYVTIKRN